MIDILKKEENFIAIRMSDHIAPEDYKIIIPLLEAMIKAYGKINLYCEIENVSEISPEAIWKDLQFDTKHLDDFDHVALVGDAQWIDWMASFAKPFTSANIQCFMTSQREAAMKWIESKTHAQV